MTVLDELRRRLPADRIQTDPDVVGSYGRDRAAFVAGGTAAVLVSPHSTAEVVAVVEAARAAGAPIVPRGAGTGLTGAANAVDGCVMVSLHRMDAVIDIDTTNRMARVQPGVINAELKKAVAAHGLFYPPDPASFEMSSIGGNVSTNAGGLCCVRYGVTRDYVMGLEVVLASGEVLRTGRRTIKSTTGLDLTGLFVGAEGLLGIITEITLKLVPAPPPPATAVAYFDHLAPAGTAIAEIFRHGHEPSLMEIIDQACIRRVEQHFHMELDTDAACLLLIQAIGGGADGLDAAGAVETMARLCDHHGASFVCHVADPTEGDLLVEVRRRVGMAMDMTGLMWLPEDVAVPRQHLAELLAGIEAIAQRRSIEIPTIGHAGDGNMHPLIEFDGNDPHAVATARQAFADIIGLSLELGGTIAAEHGVGTLKREFVELELDPLQLAVQRRVRATFDPEGLFNPGKAL
ncbi:MAG: FAD-binding protein [Acidimicrobiia bacterium]|nr:FAD-binding protein [Acidimicrobiia bacterium]